jgi:hypothetical protein
MLNPERHMTEEEIKTYWRNSADTQTININQNLLLMNLTKQLTGIDKKLKNRDMLEMAAAVLVGVFFSVQFYLTDSLQTKIGSSILVFSSLLITYKLLAARKTPLQEYAGNTTKSFLLASRNKVQNQIRLLRNVLYWYLLPLYLGLIVFITSTTGGLLISIIYIPLVTFFFYKIYQMNKKAAAALRPTIVEIDQALQQMEG